MTNPNTTNTWTTLCPLDQVPADTGKYIEVANRQLAVFRTNSSPGEPIIKVIDDTCPHAGGSLSAGKLDATLAPNTTCVVCPWHAWPFDLNSGQCPDNPKWKVATYPARVHLGQVQAQLPPT